MLIPINPNCKQKDTKWICVCDNCQNERVISYAQKWNIQTNKYPKTCRKCQVELGLIVYNIEGLELGRKFNKAKRDKTKLSLTTQYRALFAPETFGTLEIREKQSKARIGKYCKENHPGWVGGYNSDKCKESRKKARTRYNKNSPHIKNSIEAKRRAAKLQQTPSWLSLEHKEEIKEMYKLASKMSNGEIKYEVDHIIPLKGKDIKGLHVPWNLRIITASENRKKGNRVIECIN